MVTTEEIRARVEAADRARIQARADAAARIAADIERRNAVLSDLAEIDVPYSSGRRGRRDHDDRGAGRVHRHPGDRAARRRRGHR